MASEWCQHRLRKSHADEDRPYFIVFIVMNVVTAACVSLFVPEKLGTFLEEVNEVFEDIVVTIHIGGSYRAVKVGRFGAR